GRHFGWSGGTPSDPSPGRFQKNSGAAGRGILFPPRLLAHAGGKGPCPPYPAIHLLVRIESFVVKDQPGAEKRRKDETHQAADKRAGMDDIRAKSQSGCDCPSAALGEIKRGGRNPGPFVVSQRYPSYPDGVERISYVLYEGLPRQIFLLLESDERQIHTKPSKPLYGG